MYKELIVCTVIIVIIVTLDIFLQNYTKNSTMEIEGRLSKIKECIENKDMDTQEKELDMLDDIWEDKHNKLAYYIEHDELEKVETQIYAIKGFYEAEKYDEILPEAEKCTFILKHIEEKNKLSIKNIF